MFSYTSQETTHPRLRRLGARARRFSVVLVAVGAALPAGASAHPANLVADGSFESPQLASHGVLNVIAPNKLGAWTVGAGNVDLVNGPASDGAQSVDLDGTNSRGEVQQDLTTVPGHSYTITFALGANRAGAPALKRVLVGFGALTKTYTYNTATQTGWQAETIVATATASTTRLRFQSTDDIVPHQSYGPMIDDVRVVPTNLVADGSFESPQLASHGVLNVIAPNKLGAWTVGAGNVDLVNGPASDGAQSVDLDGTNSRGEVQQDLTTVPGHSYTITFALGANRAGAPALKRVLVGFGALTKTYTYNTATQTGWQAETIVATATTSTTRLRFQSTDDIVPHQSYGPMIDDVWVSQT